MALGPEQKEPFQQSKNLLQSANPLVHFDPNKDLVLACDSSAYGLGAVLTHKTEGGSEQPIAAMSRTLNTMEIGYSQTNKEALALVFGVTKFHQYLYGHHFTLVTDHKTLLGLLGDKKGVNPMSVARMQHMGTDPSRIPIYDKLQMQKRQQCSGRNEQTPSTCTAKEHPSTWRNRSAHGTPRQHPGVCGRHSARH